MFTSKKDLVHDLAALGIHEGDTLLVHSAMKPLGEVEGGCRTVIDALLTVLGSTGTLLIPALSYESVTREHPFFSVSHTPSCIGKVSETFRTTPGVVRSVHPTHSVCAYGRLANELTSSHVQDRTPVGPHSPFRLMMAHNGKILMLGCGLAPNTFMHGVEEEAGTPYVLSSQPIEYHCELVNGETVTALYTPHHFAGVAQRYDRAAALLDQKELKTGRVAAADCFLLDSNALWKKGIEKLKDSPLYFVDAI